MRAADIVAVAGIMAALCGGIWLLLTQSTDARIDEERQREAERRCYQQRIDEERQREAERRYYQQRIDDMEDR